jgi:hypothetical protein
MIEPNSLMRNNIVQVISKSGGVNLPNGIEYKIVELLAFTCKVVRADENPAMVEKWSEFSYSLLDPIKLTPSILERCGFAKKILSYTNPDEGYYYSLNLSNDKNCDLAILSGDKTGEFDCYLFPYDMIRIKHLHTLQNLTKTLTEKELEIKL